MHAEKGAKENDKRCLGGRLVGPPSHRVRVLQSERVPCSLAIVGSDDCTLRVHGPRRRCKMIRGLCGHSRPRHWSNWASWCFLFSWEVRVECFTDSDEPAPWLISSSKSDALLVKCSVCSALFKCYWTVVVCSGKMWRLFEVNAAEMSWTVKCRHLETCSFQLNSFQTHRHDANRIMACANLSRQISTALNLAIYLFFLWEHIWYDTLERCINNVTSRYWVIFL